MVYRRNLGALGASFQPTHQPYSLPAPVGGINALDALMAMPPIDCIYTFNMVPEERGMRYRKGYREWAVGCEGPVRTVLGYESQDQDLAQDRLWAVTDQGIYNVTTYGQTLPAREVTFSSNGSKAGYGVSAQFSNDASDHYLFYADYENGLHMYQEGVGWSVPLGWTKHDDDGGGAFPVSDVVFVMVHKLRIWVILRDSDDAWYLPVASIAGTLRKFTFGAKMVHGGNLMGLWNWTLDGGAGVDDFLVAVGRGGDVLIYQGSDPELADFSSNGAWYVGTVPDSRRIVAEYGSQMYVLSTFGVTALRDLINGAPYALDRGSPSAKINKFLRTDINLGVESNEWALNVHPADGFMQIITPEPSNTPYIQYNQNVNTEAWCMWKGVPMLSADSWKGNYYFGGADGQLYQYYGTLDNVTLAGDTGTAIDFELLTSYQSSVVATNYKRVGVVRVIGLFPGGVPLTVRVVYDYELSPILPTPAELPAPDNSSQWDSAIWDTSVWDSLVSEGAPVKGALGVGRVFAIALKGRSSVGGELIGWDISFTRGGFM